MSIVGLYLNLPSSFLSDSFSHKSAHNPQFRHDTILPVGFWRKLLTMIFESSTEIALLGHAFIQFRQSVQVDLLTI